MPGFDGTGPRGMGPMTGDGRGFCAVPPRPAWPPYAGRGLATPYGRGSPFAPEINRREDPKEIEQGIQKIENKKE